MEAEVDGTPQPKRRRLMSAPRPGRLLIAALVLVGCGAETTGTAGPVDASEVALVTGPPESVTAGDERSVVVRARSAVGAWVAGAEIRATVEAGGGAVTPSVAVTNAEGAASFTWQMGGAQVARFSAVTGGGSVVASTMALLPRPIVPTAPSVASPTVSGLVVSWAGVSGATRYELRRALSGDGPWTALGPRTSPSVETGLSSSTTYWYQVAACNAGGCSDWSLAGSGTTTTESLPGIGFGLEQFATIPAGSYDMGSSAGFSDERPVRRLTLTRAFLLQRTEVTQAQWRTVMGTSPSYFVGCDRCPVEQVSWDDIQVFISELNRQTGLNYRLPTEAEWEYAARAQTTGETYGPLDQVAWHSGNSGLRTQVVAQKQPNNFGLYDMLGNVWEWVQDWYDNAYYATGPSVDPLGPATGWSRVLRGGSWEAPGVHVRAAHRYSVPPSYRYVINGFRLARTL
jgi:formylglycine-generating enzyme required for sulfatase activity